MPRKNKLKIENIVKEANVARLLSDELLDKIGQTVCEDFTKDKESRKDWEDRSEEAMKLALQVREDKNFPWEKASNVKYPLLTLASVQFASRVDLFQGPDIVQVRVNGMDPAGTKTDRAVRIQKHMSYQLREEMPEWNDDNDRLYHALPIIGAMFKKTYYDPTKRRNVSELVFPSDLVFDYWAKSVEDCIRKTHILQLTPNKITEKIRTGLYLDIDFDAANALQDTERPLGEALEGLTIYEDDNAPRVLLEQHRDWDLDGDGYQEPYVITVDKETQKVCRIVARFDIEAVKYNESNEIYCIEPTEYFTQFSFIPNPDGGNLGIGFGHLLGPVNASVNTLINQLIDSGTMSIMQGGFIGKGLRLRAGKLHFQPGEWKFVQSTGDDLKNNIVPLPVHDPSPVLFQLLSLLVSAGERVGSVTDAITGENPPTNQPATTTLATIEQGLKVFKRIHIRMYAAFTKEFKKLYALNRKYLEDANYFSVIDMPPQQQNSLLPQTQQAMSTEGVMVTTQMDYLAQKDDISPTADPSVVTAMEKAKKIESLLQTQPIFNWPIEVVKKRFVEMMEFPNSEELLQPVQPPPNPDMIKLQMDQQKMQADMQNEQMRMQTEIEIKRSEAEMKQAEMNLKMKELQFEEQKMQLEVKKVEAEVIKIEAEIRKILAEIEAMDEEAELEAQKLGLEAQKMTTEAEVKRQELSLKDKEITTNAETQQKVAETKGGTTKFKKMEEMMTDVHKRMKEPKKIKRGKNGLIEAVGSHKVKRDAKGLAVAIVPEDDDGEESE